jgi:hypothetical protein
MTEEKGPTPIRQQGAPVSSNGLKLTYDVGVIGERKLFNIMRLIEQEAARVAIPRSSRIEKYLIAILALNTLSIFEHLILYFRR